MTTMSPGKLLGMRRLADEAGRFKMLAVDQRPPIENLVRQARGSNTAVFEDVVKIKELLLDNLAQYATASLLDPQYIFPAGLHRLPRQSGLLITLEYDVFEETPGGRKSAPIPDWTVQKIQAAGGDAVKVLAWYRPDADLSVTEHQQEFVATVGSECARLDMPFVFELLVYPFPSEESQTSEYVEHPQKRADQVVESV
ncbi:MAG TPA: tagatose 1,6-diphosphate aldolase, partial [Acidimicrobiia bacterium]|nr:tagatose 1,6-diphosphate aldolase [Acidimicrobiia bacterium]